MVDVHSIRETASSALGDLLRHQPDTAAKVVFAWHIAAGPTLARATSASWRDDGTLRVEASSAAWHREVVRAKPLLVRRLQQLLGPDVVKNVTVVRRGKDHA